MNISQFIKGYHIKLTIGGIVNVAWKEMERGQKHNPYLSKPDITAGRNYEMEHEQKHGKRVHNPCHSQPDITARRNSGNGKCSICNEDWLKKDIRIVLIGKTGSGKSATGNTILGRDVFLSTVSGSSVTDKCSQEHSYRFGRKILVVDMPGIFDTRPKKEEKNKGIQEEIKRCIDITSPGPHAFILVSSTIKYSEDENNSVLHFVNHFGENIYRYFIILFTRKDDLDAEGKTLMEHIKTIPPQLRKVIEMSGGRVIAFNNRLKGEESDAQVVELLSMILDNIESNGGECYTNKMYLQAERAIKEREEGDLNMEGEERDKKFKEPERNVSEKFKVEFERERYQSDKREHLREIVRKQQQETEEPQDLADQIKELKKKLEDSKGENEALSPHSSYERHHLNRFRNWLPLKYKNVKIVQTYIGTQVPCASPPKDVIVVVIDDVNVIPLDTFIDSGKTFRIVCKLWRYPSSEGVIVSNRDNEIKIPEETRLKLERCLKRNSYTLLKKHSNLQIISVSAFRSKNNGDELVFDPCIVLYCSCKGVVPYAEKEFPMEIDGIKTDVREGFFYLFPNNHVYKKSTDPLYPLRIGANIGREGQNKEGTLGGFVTLGNGDIGAITCSHLFDANSNSASGTVFNVVQPSYGCQNTNEICGRHEQSVTPSDIAHGVTVDAALIRLTDRVPQRGLFADLKANDLAELGFTHQTLPEYSKGRTRDYCIEHMNRMNACIKCGTGSGLSRGLLRLNGLSARFCNPTFSLTNPPSQIQRTYLSQFEIVGTPQKPFAEAGDSGALAFQVDPPPNKDGDDELVCIGMVVGGTSYYTTVVTPIDPILESLGVKMHVFPQEDMDVS